jgi:hypothetical protein
MANPSLVRTATGAGSRPKADSVWDKPTKNSIKTVFDAAVDRFR